MQVEIVLEVAAHPPEAVGGAVVKVPLKRRPAVVERAPHQFG